MTQTTNDRGEPFDPVTPTQTIALRVRETRKRKGWSAQALADACAEAGMPSLDRSTIAAIEIGRRQCIGVDELLVLAYVLSVAPVHLFVPLEEKWYAVTPEQVTNSGRVREWVRGRHPLPMPKAERRLSLFYSEVPEQEWEPPPSKPPHTWTPAELAAVEEFGGEMRQIGEGNGERQ